MARKSNNNASTVKRFDYLDDLIEYEKSLPAGTNLMQTKVGVRIQRGFGDDESEYVVVNDVRLQIPKQGQVEELPIPHAEVLLAKYEQEDRVQEFMEENFRGGAEP